MNPAKAVEAYIASAHYRRLYRERLAGFGICMRTLMKPAAGGISDACDAINTAIAAASDHGERPTVPASALFQRWIDVDISTSSVIEQLRDPVDLAIFKDAEAIWLDLGSCYYNGLY